jgi:hypothetical protein
MRNMLMKAGAIGFALGVLGLSMVHAGLASGCGKSQAAAPPQAEPEITTKASEDPAKPSEDPAKPSEDPSETSDDPTEASEATTPKPKYRVYGPASKAGPILHAPNPPQQQSKP